MYSSEPHGYTTKPRITMAVHVPRSVFPPVSCQVGLANQKYSSEPHGYTIKPRITMAVHVPRSVFPFVLPILPCEWKVGLFVCVVSVRARGVKSYVHNIAFYN